MRGSLKYFRFLILNDSYTISAMKDKRIGQDERGMRFRIVVL